jgi:asparagine synthase (glutamine-hydrolysing)
MSAICGLFGRLSAEPSAAESLATMLRAMSGRASGASESFVAEHDVKLGVRSGPGGGSAVRSTPDRRFYGVMDGEIFNRRDVVAWLAGKSSNPGNCDDTELALRLFAEEGVDGFKRVDGQFAIAIWERGANRLTLIRDFLGVIPVYYSSSPRGAMFASEAKGLLAHPASSGSYDLGAVSDYLTFLSVPAPSTLFAGVQKLLPGHAVAIDAAGNATLTRYWDLLDAPVPEREDAEFYIDRVRELHKQSVQRRMVAGPIGSMLSGGNDSSANAALMARYATGPLHTFTVGLKEVEGEPAYTDLAYARKVAEHIGSTHHELMITTDEFIGTIPRITELLDDLVSEPSSIFLYKALELAKSEGLTTVLTGEANDEIGCGHGEMINIRNGYYRRWAPFMRWPSSVRKLLAVVGPLVSPQRADILGRAARDDDYFWSFEIGWPDSRKGDVMTSGGLRRLGAHTSRTTIGERRKHFERSEHARRDYLNYIVYAMMQNVYFGNLMLGKLDLLARGLGLDARCPYSEPQYAHFVYNIPARYKMQDGMVKWFFKKAIEGLLPNEIIYRPKQGFRTPVVELFRGPLATWARPYLLDGGFTKEGLISRSHIERLLEEHRRGPVDHSNKLWTLMVLNLWHERWVASKPRAASAA